MNGDLINQLTAEVNRVMARSPELRHLVEEARERGLEMTTVLEFKFAEHKNLPPALQAGGWAMSVIWGNSLDLSRAKLCMNCETLSDATGERCPKCAAIANWLTLSTVLSEDRDRQESDKLARAVIAERERKIHAFRKDGAA